jgi:protein-tyrosine phosphatase
MSDVTDTAGEPAPEPRPAPEAEPAPGSRIAIGSVLNLRDVGGWPTQDGGRVRRGQVYRSGALDRLTKHDASALAALGVRAVYDLRTHAERTEWPDRLPRGAVGVPLDVFDGAVDPVTAKVREGDDSAGAAALLGGADGESVFARGYRALVSLPSARAAYGGLFKRLATAEGRPALVHCAVGKDRTGWGVAALLLFLRVPEDLVMAEFLTTNRDLFPDGRALVGFRVPGGDPDRPAPLVVLRPGYLEAGLAQVRAEFGGIEGYVAEGLGLDDETRAALRAALTQRD